MSFMKTAISIPEPIFKKADYEAKKRGLSRSQLYVLAIQAFITKGGDKVTQMLDDVYSKQENRSFDGQVEQSALADLPREEW